MISKTSSGKWRVDIRLANGVRKRKTFRTQADAKHYLHFAKSKAHDSDFVRGRQKDERRLSDLIDLWYELHGTALKTGNSRRSILQMLATKMGNPLARNVTPALYSELRQLRLKDGISENGCNHDLAYLRAVFNELSRLGQIDYPSPLQAVRQLRVVPTELTILTNDQIITLLKGLGDHPAGIVARVCLSTGARWAEAQGLKFADLVAGQVRYLGKNNKYRFFPVNADFFLELQNYLKENGSFPRVCYDEFRRCVERLGIDLPRGQLTHVLRHTFACAYLKSTGDLKGLQAILDHSNISVTSRYLHAMPDFAASVLKSNPLALAGI